MRRVECIKTDTRHYSHWWSYWMRRWWNGRARSKQKSKFARERVSTSI